MEAWRFDGMEMGNERLAEGEKEDCIDIGATTTAHLGFLAWALWGVSSDGLSDRRVRWEVVFCIMIDMADLSLYTLVEGVEGEWVVWRLDWTGLVGEWLALKRSALFATFVQRYDLLSVFYFFCYLHRLQVIYVRVICLLSNNCFNLHERTDTKYCIVW